MTVEAVTFDYWNTLAHEPTVGHTYELRTARWVERLLEAGYEVEPERVASAMTVVAQRFNEHWRNNRLYLAPEAALDTLAELKLGRPVGEDLRDRLVEDFVSVGREARIDLTDGIVDALDALHDAGVRIGIICDVGMTPSPVLREHLERHGVLRFFTCWSFSDEVGCYKPDGRIFAHALESLGGVDPTAAVHVGDIRRTDIAGARAVGMRAVRYTGVADDTSDGPEGDWVVADHRKLPELLLG